MEPLKRLGHEQLRAAMLAYDELLPVHRQRLNYLDFEDNDTGDNLVTTVRRVAVELYDTNTMANACDAIERGSRLGRQGTSGTLLSHVLRGVTKRLRTQQWADGKAFAASLIEGSVLADHEAPRSVEGRIRTVVRDAAGAAASSRDDSLIAVLEAAATTASVSLDHTPKLTPTLAEAGVVDAGGAGFVLLLDAFLHVTDGRPLPESDPYEHVTLAAEYIAVTAINNRLRVISLSPDHRYRFLDSIAQHHRIQYVESLERAAFAEAAEELERLINNPASAEADLQAFFVRFPHFLTGDSYAAAHPHIALSSSDGLLIPDFVLQPEDPLGLSDLLELKLPRARVVTRRGRPRLSAEVLAAATQLRAYSDYFEDPEKRQRVNAVYGLNVFRPRMYVVIGRRGTVDPIVFRRAEGEVPFLTIRTYDDLLDRVRRHRGP